jgi:hypothetical protein
MLGYFPAFTEKPRPCLKMKLGDLPERETSVIHNVGRNPFWKGELCKFKLEKAPDCELPKSLVVECWHCTKKGPHRLIGTTTVPLPQVYSERGEQGSYKQEQAAKGWHALTKPSMWSACLLGPMQLSSTEKEQSCGSVELKVTCFLVDATEVEAVLNCKTNKSVLSSPVEEDVGERRAKAAQKTVSF